MASLCGQCQKKAGALCEHLHVFVTMFSLFGINLKQMDLMRGSLGVAWQSSGPEEQMQGAIQIIITI